MEAEATHRAIRLAELAELPVYIVHLFAKEALEAVVEVRDAACQRLLKPAPCATAISGSNKTQSASAFVQWFDLASNIQQRHDQKPKHCDRGKQMYRAIRARAIANQMFWE